MMILLVQQDRNTLGSIFTVAEGGGVDVDEGVDK